MGSIEVPVLRLGLAGFSPEQERAIEAAAAASRITHWQSGPMTAADAWFVNGLSTQHLGAGRIRVASRQAGGRSVQLQLADIQKPVAFALPLPATMQAACSFDLGDPPSIVEAIGVFEFMLAPLAAQFLLAAQVVDQQEMLGSGAFELRAKGHRIAVVDMKGDAAVLPSVRPANFDAAVWTRVDRDRLRFPDNFVRTSLAQLMWLYVSRTPRDLLPERYRKAPIFFRRPPRIDPVRVDEVHLLVMRELAIRPATLDELQRRLELPAGDLARAVAALYYVGSVTSNRLRAGPTTIADDLARGPRAPTRYGELRTGHVPLEVTDLRELTAPAPLALA